VETRLGYGAVFFASENVAHAPSWKKLKPGTLAIAHGQGTRLEMHHL
jgi:hypothetical protein